MMKYLYKFYIVLLMIGVCACSDFLTPSLKQNKEVSNSIKTAHDLSSLMDGAYAELTSYDYYGRSFVVNGEVRSGNAFSTGHSGRYVQESKLTYTPTDVGGLWQAGYNVIASTNIIINSKIPDSPEVSYIKGQAYALRAMVFMDLLTRYGQTYVEESDLGIPYITTYNEGNLYPSRDSVEDTQNKIESDFQKAVSMMSPELDGPSTTLTYYGALALQARYYLTIHSFTMASTAAKEVIDSGDYQIVSANNYVSSWAKDGNSNSIFELAESTSGTTNGIGYIYQNTSYGDIQVTPELYNLYDSGDVRKDLYSAEKGGKTSKAGTTVYRMTGKYPDRNGTDDIRVIRYAEVVLTYAEAQAELTNQKEAKKYLDMITSNRNESNYAVASIDNIRLERRKELAMEGQRFRDLMRTGQGVVRDLPIRNNYDISVPWGSYQLAFPIPRHEVDANTSIEQNKGY